MLTPFNLVFLIRFYHITYTIFAFLILGGLLQTRELNAQCPTFNTDLTHLTCYDDESGQIEFINVVDGTPPYSYSIDNGSNYELTPLFTDLDAGTYDLIVRDDLGCTTPASVTLNEPDQITFTPILTNLSCFNDASGEIEFDDIQNGVGSFEFSIDSAATFDPNPVFTNLDAGTYHLAIQDDNGCETFMTVVLTQPDTLIFDFTPSHLSCFEDETGEILFFDMLGGTPPYEYSIDNGNTYDTDPNFTGLDADTYSLVVRDDSLCTSHDAVTLNEPDQITFTPILTNLSCFNDASGEIEFDNVQNGIGSFEFSIDSAVTFSSNPVFANLDAGTYHLAIQDDDGCETFMTVVLTQPDTLIFDFTPTHLSCFEDETGEILFFDMLGGTPPYEFSIDNGNTYDTDPNFTGLDADTYSLVVRDDSLCTSHDAVTLNEPDQITFTPILTNLSCFNDASGEIEFDNVQNGIGSFEFSIDSAVTFSSNPVFANLDAGTYHLAIQDDDGCETFMTVVLTQPDTLIFDFTPSHLSCFEDETGEILFFDMLGGTPPYEFSIDNGLNYGTNPNFTGLDADTYTLVVRDDSLCTSHDAVTLNEPDQITFTPILTNLLCFNDASGEIEFDNIQNGVGSFEFSIDDGNTFSANPVFENLDAGNYDLVIKDDDGCETTLTVPIAQPIEISFDLDVSNLLCYEDNSGSIEFSNTSGNAAPFEYSIDNGGNFSTTTNFTGLSIGTYNLIVRDSDLCTKDTTVTITQPNPLSFNQAVTHLQCFEDGTGEIEFINMIGGTTPYEYSIDNGDNYQAGTTFSSLQAGAYNLILRDDNNCTRPGSVTLFQPDEIIATIDTFANNTCFGLCDGFFEMTVSGGIAGYTYEWLDSNDVTLGSSLAINDLCEGAYRFVVRDNVSCYDTTMVNIISPDELEIQTIPTDISCPGLCNGRIESVVTGGTLPYTYLWNDDNASQTATVENLCPGIFEVEVVDSNNCSVSAIDSVAETLPLMISGSSTNANCDVDDGSTTVTVIQGEGPFTYQWDANAGNQTTATATNLFSGCYNVTVSDVNGCSESLLVCLQDRRSPNIAINSQGDATCFGGDQGFIVSSASGGTAPYSYTWTDSQGNVVGNLSQVTGLSAGTYVASVVDDVGCQGIVSVAIGEPPLLTATASSVNTVCHNQCTGQATATPNGGTAGYTYLWNDPNAQTGATANNLCIGSYEVIVRDVHNCQTTATVIVDEPDDISFNTNVVDAFCGSNSGSALVENIQNATPPFTYLWNTFPQQTDNPAENLFSGTYNVTVTDVLGCSKTQSFTVDDADSYQVVISNFSGITCFGETDGTASASVSGAGTPPYTFSWMDASTDTPINQFEITATNLPAGDYYVIVTDLFSCSVLSDTVTIIEPSAPLDISLTPTDLICFNVNSGAVLASPSGGTPPYFYAWNDPLNQTTDEAINLGTGNYCVTVTDNSGCQISACDEVINLNPPLELSFSKLDANCNQSDGGTCALVAGGSGGYSYLWENGETSNCNQNIPSGNYEVTVTDSEGCNETASVNIQDLQGIPLSAGQVIHNSCYGGCEGEATVVLQNPTPNPLIIWDANANNQTNATATNLCAGVYTVEVINDDGCSTFETFTINEPDEIIHNLVYTDPSCFNFNNGSASVSVIGGTPPYFFLWEDGNGNNLNINNNSIENLSSGDYSLSIFDFNNCSVNNLNFTLNNPPLFEGHLEEVNSGCFIQCNGQLTVVTTTGVAPFSYQWDINTGNQTGATAFNLCEGTYSVLVTDNQGCTLELTGSITSPDELAVSISDQTNASCFGVCDASAIANPTGGTPPYSFSWSSGSDLQIPNNLCAGGNIVTVTDANGCTATASVNIIQPQPLNVNFNTVSTTCHGLCNGSATAFPSGGTSPYSYQWNDLNLSTSQTISTQCAGTYQATITDVNGCQAVANALINQPNDFNVNAVITSSNCQVDDGIISVTVSGGFSPYTYQWNDPQLQTTPEAVDLFAGCYKLIVTDSIGCTKDTTLCVNDNGGADIVLTTSENVSCFEAQDGVVQFGVNGGDLPYQFIEWFKDGSPYPLLDGSTSSSTLSGGCYTIAILDNSSCFQSKTACISEPPELNSAITTFIHPTCADSCNGVITVQASGGIGNYSYQWNNEPPIGTATNFGLCDGDNAVVVFDENLCASINTIQLVSPTPIAFQIIDYQDASCFETCDGRINVSVTGGVGNYNYSWNPFSSSSALATNLCSGIHELTVIDGNGCIGEFSHEITQPTELTADHTTVTARCSEANGEATISPQGGTSPYAFNWFDHGDFPDQATNTGLFPGDYVVEVSDDNLCSILVELTIGDEASPVIDTIISISPTCYDAVDGSAEVFASGGIPPYTYLWDSGDTQSEATNLDEGTYCATVIDQNNCSVSKCIIISKPSPLIAISNEISVCNGQLAAIWGIGEGGTLPYEINWLNENTEDFDGFGPHIISPESSTSFCFELIDNNGCSPETATGCIEVEVLPELGIDLPSMIQICEGEEVTLVGYASGGKGAPYHFVWTENDVEGNHILSENAPVNSAINVSPSETKWYFLTISDYCSTQVYDSVLVSIYNDYFLEVIPDDSIGCAPLSTYFIVSTNAPNPVFFWDFYCNDTLDIDTTGFIVPFTFEEPGVFDICLEIVDENGCITTRSFENFIEVYYSPEADFYFTPEDATIINPEITFFDQSIDADYYHWDFGDGYGVSGPWEVFISDEFNNNNKTTGTFNNPFHFYAGHGEYPVTLITETVYGCSDTITKIVKISPDYMVYVPNAFTPNGDGRNDTFYPQGLGINPTNFSFRIFDRWGSVVYENNYYDESMGWDGTANGKELPMGVYVWIITTEDLEGETTEYKGHVTLIR
jgi:gliding motility-associated-like protein